MQSRRLRWQVLATTIPILIVMIFLVACEQEKPTPVVNRPQQGATDQAATDIALTNAPPTRGPSPTPTITPTPYMTPTQFPDADPDMIVAKVGNREISLKEFQARVAYERWLPFYAIANNVPELGLKILDLSRPENAETLALLYTLNQDPYLLGTQVMNAMTTDQIILREAGRMDLELEQTIFDGRMAARIDVDLGPRGQRPDNWDEAYDQFITDMQTYTGMTEAQFVEHIRALTFYQQLRQIIGEQATLPNEDVITAATVQDILLDTREEALEFIDGLENGQNFQQAAEAIGKAPENGNASRMVRRNTEGLTDELKFAIFNAEIDDVIGPIATEAGWYVAKILDFDLDVASPSDIQALRESYFRNWIVERLDDPEYTTIYENWEDFVPTRPLPEDISPVLRTENFILPDSPFSPVDEPTPTALPIGSAPR